MASSEGTDGSSASEGTDGSSASEGTDGSSASQDERDERDASVPAARDDRLRAAVAAWVASADDAEGDTGRSQDARSQDDVGDGDGDGDGDGAGDEDEDRKPSDEDARPVGKSGADEPAGPTVPEAAEAGDEAPADSPAAPARTAAPAKATAPLPDRPAEDTRPEPQPSAPEDTEDSRVAEDTGAPGNAEDPEGSETSEKPGAPTKPGTPTKPEAPGAPEAAKTPEASKADEPAPEADDPASKADKTDEADKADEPAPPVDRPTRAFAVLRPPLDHPTTSLKTVGGPSSSLKDRPKPGTGQGTEPATTSRPDGGRPASGPATGPTAEPAQRTGAKLGKPAQRTGAKLGKPARKRTDVPGERPAAAATGAGTAEAEAERTSTFVPLRPLDERNAPPAEKAAPPKQPPPSWATDYSAPRPAASPNATTGELPRSAVVGPEHTRQQPLPPKPPLDLLAELTNTPPPPETPLRTAVRRVKIWTPLVLLLLIVFAVVQTVRPLPDPALSLTASDTFSFGGQKPRMPWPKSGQAAMDVDGLGTFGSSGQQKPVPIASVAKVMTAYIVLRDHPVKAGSDGVKITMDQKAEDDAGLSAQNESTVEVRKGQRLTQKEAIEAIMIASANNIARRLARWDAGSEQAFVEKMNKTADELGMGDTTYTDPSGLNKTTVSTAADQVKLGKKAMKDPLFREVVRMPSYTDSNGKNQPNWNQLVPMNNTVGIKTGTTTAAGGNLMFAATKDVGGTTRTVIGAVLAQPPSPVDNSILTGALSAGSSLIKAAQGELEAKTVVRKGDVVGQVDDGLGGTTPVVATKNVTAVGWSGLTVKLSLTDEGKVPPHEAKAGTKVGVLRVGDGTSGAVEVPVALQNDLTEPGFGAKLRRLG
ncbi:D-alanyl-D-alanine carboxypeptidase [Streptomyces sp. NPDC007088]|uniref:D-alanyl-D-alanine carboxypeptidase n=1 Tax=Streptomyces sp. NPDC007088 TaxID=3364773 RepID=UPI0036CF1CC2